ncbi:MAG TPA: hypothetical protein VFI42_21175 [Thermomicrobiaceae bacterium]|nr:hypothetical protein [Thermomicrobiaceae bacterium]
MIQGVEITRLTTHADERGSLTELIRRDDPFFEQFGQCHVSIGYPGVIRGSKNIGVEPYDPADSDEYRISFDSPDIPYSWDISVH